MPLNFALNRMCAPHMPLESFAAMAQRLDVRAIEIRNDLHGVEMLDGTDAAQVGAVARAHGLTIRSINALQRFDQFDAQREAEARTLMAYAAACGAQALVLCPTNSLRDPRSAAQRQADLQQALTRLVPLLEAHRLTGLIEPLGFAECAVRRKALAVDAIEAVGAPACLALVHDTFHHHLAGDARLFPARTGLVHVSGVEDTALAPDAMRDGHRVLVGPGDRLDNTGQLRALLDAGYAGLVSFEPFADVIGRAADIEAQLRASMAHLRAAIGQPG